VSDGRWHCFSLEKLPAGLTVGSAVNLGVMRAIAICHIDPSCLLLVSS
jgi:hypothetical protein